MTPIAPKTAAAPHGARRAAAAAPWTRLAVSSSSRRTTCLVVSAAPRNHQPSPPQQPVPATSEEGPAAGRSRKQHVWTVGLDFGTYASGFGYYKVAAPNGPAGGDGSSGGGSGVAAASSTPAAAHGTAGGAANAAAAAAGMPAGIKLHHRWPDQPLPDYKTRTVCLYRGSKLEAWGWTAWQRWTRMTEQERRDGDYHYVEGFKLLLLGSPPPGVSLPPGLTDVQVVADFLSELRGYVYKHLARSDPGSPLDPTAITWCLTVPAMWDESAKAKMRQAANRAGMARAADPSSLLMVLEPEAAAAAAVMHQRSSRRGSSSTGSGKSPHPTAAAAAAAGAAAAIAADASKVAELREVPRFVEESGHSNGGASDGGGGAGGAAAASTMSATLRDGDVLLVLDCGGGTADITMHRVVGAGPGVRLQEAAAGSGVLAGGRHVDDALWRHLRVVVGGPVWDAWREQQPGEWIQTATEWEAAKRQPRGPVVLQLRPKLMEMWQSHRQVPFGDADAAGDTDRDPAGATAATTAVAPETGSGRVGAASETDLGAAALIAVRDDGSCLVPEQLLERDIYGPVVDKIAAAATEVLDEGRRGGNAATKMLLAGGMANSPYVQQRVRQLAQEHGVPLLMPRQPQALVVSGAVLFGQFPSLVVARRSRQTYGISCRSIWTSEDAASNASFGYPAKLWKEDDREYVADGVFESYVRRNQLVQMDEAVRRIFCPTSRSTTAVGIDLYATDAYDARYTREPGMRKVATVTMELPPGWAATVLRRQDYDIEVELRFGGTEITLFARDPRTNNAVATSVQWAPEQVTAAAAAVKAPPAVAGGAARPGAGGGSRG